MSQATEPIFRTAITVDVPSHHIATLRFVAGDDRTTRVELEHAHLDRHGTDWPQLQAAISNTEGGWPGLLRAFAKSAQ